MEEDVCPSNILQQPEICNKSKCINDADTQKLQCISCKRKVHYKCTLLPPYQIHRYITFSKNYSTYICVNCIEVPDSLQNSDWSEQHSFREKYEQELQHANDLRETIHTLTEKIHIIENELDEAKIKTSNDDHSRSKSNKSTQKKRRIDEENPSDDNNVSNDDTEIVTQEIERLRKQNENLNERLNEREMALDETLQQLADANNTAVESKESKSLVDRIEKTFTERFKNMQANLIEIIDEKININSNSKINDKRSYASTAAGTVENNTTQGIPHQIIPSAQNFRSLMMSTRNEELAEEKDKKERMCNIIIHGKGENKEQTEDSEFINNNDTCSRL